MIRTLLMLGLISAAFVAAGCNTVQGFAEDIDDTSKSAERAMDGDDK